MSKSFETVAQPMKQISLNHIFENFESGPNIIIDLLGLKHNLCIYYTKTVRNELLLELSVYSFATLQVS